MGFSPSSSTPTSTSASTDSPADLESILWSHYQWAVRFGYAADFFPALPYLYFTPKLHKLIPGTRFICGCSSDATSTLSKEFLERIKSPLLRKSQTDKAASSDFNIRQVHDRTTAKPRCSTTGPSKALSKTLRLVIRTLQDKDTFNIRHHNGLRRCWIISGVHELVSLLKNNPSFFRNVQPYTADFSTMYTSLPQDAIIHNVGAAVKEAFLFQLSQMGFTRGEADLGRIGIRVRANRKSPAVWERIEGEAQPFLVKPRRGSQETSERLITYESILEHIRFIVQNTFLCTEDGQIRWQTTGIPMGTNAGPELANLCLYFIEAAYMDDLVRRGMEGDEDAYQRALQLHFTVRFIDDLFCLGCKPPPEEVYGLKWLCTLRENGLATFLGNSFNSTPDGFRIAIFDKTEDYKFDVKKYPSALSNMASHTVPGIYIGQLGEYHRTCTHWCDLAESVSKIARRMLQNGHGTALLAKGWRTYVNLYWAGDRVQQLIAWHRQLLDHLNEPDQFPELPTLFDQHFRVPPPIYRTQQPDDEHLRDLQSSLSAAIPHSSASLHHYFGLERQLLDALRASTQEPLEGYVVQIDDSESESGADDTDDESDDPDALRHESSLHSAMQHARAAGVFMPLSQEVLSSSSSSSTSARLTVTVQPCQLSPTTGASTLLSSSSLSVQPPRVSAISTSESLSSLSASTSTVTVPALQPPIMPASHASINAKTSRNSPILTLSSPPPTRTESSTSLSLPIGRLVSGSASSSSSAPTYTNSLTCPPRKFNSRRLRKMYTETGLKPGVARQPQPAQPSPPSRSPRVLPLGASLRTATPATSTVTLTLATTSCTSHTIAPTSTGDTASLKAPSPCATASPYVAQSLASAPVFNSAGSPQVLSNPRTAPSGPLSSFKLLPWEVVDSVPMAWRLRPEDLPAHLPLSDAMSVRDLASMYPPEIEAALLAHPPIHPLLSLASPLTSASRGSATTTTTLHPTSTISTEAPSDTLLPSPTVPPLLTTISVTPSQPHLQSSHIDPQSQIQHTIQP